MKWIFISTFILFSFVNFAAAQDEPYLASISAMAQEAENLSVVLAQKTITCPQYDQWYNRFKPRAEALRKDFANEYKQRDSFQRVQVALDAFSLAWTALKQADYAATQYQDYITSGDVGYAHKWKEQAVGQRKEALEKIDEACAALREAKIFAEKGT